MNAQLHRADETTEDTEDIFDYLTTEHPVTDPGFDAEAAAHQLFSLDESLVAITLIPEDDPEGFTVWPNHSDFAEGFGEEDLTDL